MIAMAKAPKEYICVMRLHGNVSENEIREVCKEFTGQIYQRPPLKSSVKRVVRIRTIYYIDLLEISNRDVLMRIGCEAGTYIRKLCHDIGIVLGTGGHMQELRRTKSGVFKEDELRKIILPVEKVIEGIPKITIRDSAVDAICHGANLAAQGILTLESNIKRGSLVAIITKKGELVALGISQKSSEEILNEERGIMVKVRRVIMERGTYPKMWK